MSDYEDAMDSIEEDDIGEDSPLNSVVDGIRQRRPFQWEDSISISSDLPGLHEVQVCQIANIHLSQFLIIAMIYKMIR